MADEPSGTLPEEKSELADALEAATSGVIAGLNNLAEVSADEYKELENVVKELNQSLTKLGLSPLVIPAESVLGKVAERALTPLDIIISATVAVNKVAHGGPADATTIESIAGSAGATIGELAASAVLGGAAFATAPAWVVAALTGVIAGVASFAAGQLATYLLKKFETGSQAAAPSTAAQTMAKQFNSDITNSVRKALSVFSGSTGGSGPPPVGTTPSLDFSTPAGQQDFQNFLNEYQQGATSALISLLSNLGITPATDPTVNDIGQGIASIAGLYSSAVSSTTGLPADQQVQAFGSYINANYSQLPSDALNAVGTELATATGQSYTISDGAVIIPDNGDLSVSEAVTGSDINAVSTTPTYNDEGDVVSQDTEFGNGDSEIATINPLTGDITADYYSGSHGSGTLIGKTVESGSAATTSSFDASGDTAGIDFENFDSYDSVITTVDPDTHVETVTSYTQIFGEGTGTVLSVEYTNSFLANPSSVGPQTFVQIAQTLGYDSPFVATAIAAMNGQYSANVTAQYDSVYVPSSVGLLQVLGLPTPVSSGSDEEASASNSWSFSGGGILVLGLGATPGSFTPLATEGADDPSTNTIYVIDSAGDLIDVLPGSGETNVTATVTDDPAGDYSDVATTFTVWQVDGASYEVINNTDGSGTFETFGSESSEYGLPFFAVSGSGGSSADAKLRATTIGNGSGDLATFDSSSDTPDENWSIGVDAEGDAVFTGRPATSTTSGAGFTGTAILTEGQAITIYYPDGSSYQTYNPIIAGVELDQSIYGLDVIPDSGESGTAGLQLASSTIFAEGTGTSNINLETFGTNYWHINGYDDTFTVGSGTTEFYMAGSVNDYQLTWSAAKAILTVTGGSTGTTTFQISSGNGAITFAGDFVIGLGSSDQEDAQYNAYFGGPASYVQELDGGDQIVYGFGEVIFASGADVPDAWNISTAGTGSNMQVVFDGTNAGYDGVASLSGVSVVVLNDLSYLLDAVTEGASEDVEGQNGYSGIIVADEGNANLVFDATNTAETSYWFVGGAGDSAKLQAGFSEIVLDDDESDYSLGYNASGEFTITGGSTGTIAIALAGGTGELEFGDGNVIGLGDVGDGVEYGGGLDTSFSLYGGYTYTNGGPGGGVVTLQDSGSSLDQHWSVTEDSQDDVILDGLNATYGGEATLANINQVGFGGYTYDLLLLPQAGNGAFVVGASEGAIVVDSGSQGNTVSFDYPGPGGSYWHVNGADDTAIFNSGFASLYLTGNENQYSLSTQAGGTFAFADSVPNRNGVTNVVVGEGEGLVGFADGNFVFFSAGTEEMFGGYLSLSGGSTITEPQQMFLENGTTLEVAAPVTNALTIEFEAPYVGLYYPVQTDTLEIDDPATFGSQVGLPTYTGPLIENFLSGDTIDLTGLAYNPGSTVSYDPATGVLQISSGAQFASLFFGANNETVNDPFHLGQDDSGGTILTNDAMPCFCQGTRISTQRGEIRVEDLVIGDLVRARFAGLAAIRWIGYRRIDCGRHPVPKTVWPVRVKAHSFGAAQPSCDLWLSPDHAVYMDGVLIPVRYLVNGESVVQERRDQITYWHVEVERHDVVFAEGLACETFLDTGNRHALGREHSHRRPHADFASRAWEGEGCAPLVITGPALDGVRRRLQDEVEGQRSCGGFRVSGVEPLPHSPMNATGEQAISWPQCRA